ncbi:MAG TPA: hypothetical protein VJ723_05585 [Candidatus Angelobacter sp.]|nr:hypothetical protein [Candidatus Angelobacter sp.]
MRRPAFFFLPVFVFAVSALAQVNIPGVLSTKPAPVPDGRTHGVPAPGPNANSRGVSATAKPPQSFRRLSVHLPMPLFGDPHRHGREIVTIPLFYPVYLYPYPNNSLVAEEPQAGPDSSPSPDDQALQDAYNRGAQDALAQRQARNAQRDPREDNFNQPADAKPRPAPEPARFIEPEPDNGPPTVFIFKDGHRVETKSYAIMGQTLFDLSSKPVRKIQLDDLDLAATTKVNDELGNPLRF